MKKILVFGEVLFDIFEGNAVIGGAPFNFAAHFSALGGRADLVSAIGKDDLGKTALEEMSKKGIGRKHLVENDKPTGCCIVRLENALPQYELMTERAYDYIPEPEITEAYDGLYFGTLAQRSPLSARTLNGLLHRFRGTSSEIFLDVNIRPPFYNSALLDKSIAGATLLKVSREEAGTILPYTHPEEFTAALLKNYPGLRQVILTLDKEGAMVNDRIEGIFYAPKPLSRPVSTVGAGDSFGAAYFYHRLQGDPVARCLEAATLLSDYVVTRTEAVPELPEDLKRKII